MRSASRSASSRYCVVKKMVTPEAARPEMTCHMVSRPCGSRPVDGSSRRTWDRSRRTSKPTIRACPPSGSVSVARMRTVVVLPAPLRILCRLTRGNRQPCHPVGDRRVATARLAGKRELTGGAARPWHCVRPPSGLPGLYWVHEHDVCGAAPLGGPAAGGRTAASSRTDPCACGRGSCPERDLPFFALFEADPDLAERAEVILASEPAAEVPLPRRERSERLPDVQHRVLVHRNGRAIRQAAG
jgi:hypothetical protein